MLLEHTRSHITSTVTRWSVGCPWDSWMDSSICSRNHAEHCRARALSSRAVCLAPVSGRVVCVVVKCLPMIETWTQLSKLIKEAREGEALGCISWHFKLCSIINKNANKFLYIILHHVHYKIPWNKEPIQMGNIRDFCGKCGGTCAKRCCVQNALVLPWISAGYITILIFNRHAVLSDTVNATTNLSLLHLLIFSRCTFIQNWVHWKQFISAGFVFRCCNVCWI